RASESGNHRRRKRDRFRFHGKAAESSPRPDRRRPAASAERFIRSRRQTTASSACAIMSIPLSVNPNAPLQLDPRTYTRGLSCVHCGLCLPACPTYTQTLNEADSPRGRIQLMMGLAEGKIEASESAKLHLDLCLDCRACETACPSGVVYHELIEETRARLLKQSSSTLTDRLMRWIFFHVFVHPTRLKLALLPARLMQKIGLYALLRRIGIFKLLPAQLRKMEQMLPP